MVHNEISIMVVGKDILIVADIDAVRLLTNAIVEHLDMRHMNMRKYVARATRYCHWPVFMKHSHYIKDKFTSN